MGNCCKEPNKQEFTCHDIDQQTQKIISETPGVYFIKHCFLVSFFHFSEKTKNNFLSSLPKIKCFSAEKIFKENKKRAIKWENIF
jgi:hypothetical protein